MNLTNKNSPEDTITALEDALRLLEKKSAQRADAEACLWVKPNGEHICVQLPQEDCAEIKGMVFVGGRCEKKQL